MNTAVKLLDSIGVQEDGVSIAYPDTFDADIRAALTEDASIYDAKILTLTTELTEAQAEIARLKAHNYDLITNGPESTDDPEADPADPEDDPEDNPDEEENQGVSSLFSEK